MERFERSSRAPPHGFADTDTSRSADSLQSGSYIDPISKQVVPVNDAPLIIAFQILPLVIVFSALAALFAVESLKEFRQDDTGQDDGSQTSSRL